MARISLKVRTNEEPIAFNEKYHYCCWLDCHSRVTPREGIISKHKGDWGLTRSGTNSDP